MATTRQKFIRTFLTSAVDNTPSGPINDNDPSNRYVIFNPLLSQRQPKVSSSTNLLVKKSLIVHNVPKPTVIDEKHNSYERYLNRKKGIVFDCEC